MASTSNRNRRRRPVSQPTEGNLARKLDSRRPETAGQAEFDRPYHRPPESDVERRARQRAAARAAVRTAQHLSPVLLVSFTVTAVLMVAVLLCYVKLNGISRSIVDMKTQIEALEAQQVSLLTRYEQAFDLTSVKEAAEAAGMVQPSDSQIYYVDLPGSDQAVSFSDDDAGLLVRVTGKIREKLAEFAEYFRQ